MRIVLVLRSTFELPQEPMRFILVLRSTFELQQEPMRFIIVLRSTFEVPEEPMSGIKWNFTKFLINREGQVMKRYSPLQDPSVVEKDLSQYL